MNAQKSVFAFIVAMALSFIAFLPQARAGNDDIAGVLGDNQNVSTSILATQRGGSSDSALATATATVSGNINLGGMTGSNFNMGSFVGAAGIFTVLQNTGNNVAIQSQTILNVNLN